MEIAGSCEYRVDHHLALGVHISVLAVPADPCKFIAEISETVGIYFDSHPSESVDEALLSVCSLHWCQTVCIEVACLGEHCPDRSI